MRVVRDRLDCRCFEQSTIEVITALRERVGSFLGNEDADGRIVAGTLCAATPTLCDALKLAQSEIVSLAKTDTSFGGRQHHERRRAELWQQGLRVA